jgi:hypothetical protein
MKRRASRAKATPGKISDTKTSRRKASDRNSRPKEIKQMSPEPTASKGSLAKPATAARPNVAGEGNRQPATIRYLDRADMVETFADSITGLIFDGQTLRIEFGVTRFDDVKPNTPITGRRYPACRIVMPPAAAVDLINRMQQIANALTQAGVVKTTPRPVAAPAKAD